MMCSANSQCLHPGDSETLEEQYDRYNIYAGRWHTDCWDRFGYKDFVFDEGYAGESLEEVE